MKHLPRQGAVKVEDGRRIQDFRAWAGEKRLFTYNYDGTLIRANDFTLEWTGQGQLAAVEQQGRSTTYAYGADTRLDHAALAKGTDVRYLYGRELLPVRITVNGVTAAEYQWQDVFRLARHKDCLNGITHEFVYGAGRAPVQVVVSGAADAVYRAVGVHARQVALHVWTDQVDSIRVLSLPDGKPVKCVEYDAFGNVAADTRPDWKFPLGFACGLNDPWTGFVRFGFRDYDPKFGRFTAKDPIGFTGGDKDLWDYCVDDPVGANDFNGLFLFPILPSGYQLSEEDKRNQTGVEGMIAETAIDMGLEMAGIPNPMSLAKAASGRRALGVIPQVSKTIDVVHGWASGTPTAVTDKLYESYDKIGKGLERFWDIVPGEVAKLPGAISKKVSGPERRKK